MKKLTIIGGVILVVVACVATVLLLYLQKNKTKSSAQPTVVAAEMKPSTNKTPAKTLSSTMLFVGEVFWGRGIEYYSKRSPLGYDYPFSGLTMADRQGFDAWVGDMECPITNKDIAYQTQVDALLFNCRPEYVAEAAKWFNVLTLANNHTDNNGGEWGLEQTRKNLAAHSIQYFGDYNMRNTANICEVVAMPARFTVEGSEEKKITMPLALCGFDYVGSVQPRQIEYDVMKQYAKLMPVIAMPHMGVEYRATAEETKMVVYHQLIDNGADVVIGAHPHVVQNSENYKGRLIVYSTGNFMFDQQSLGRDTVLSLGVVLSLKLSETNVVDAYTSLTNCQISHDDCLAQLEQKLTKRPVFTVSYDSRCFEQSSNIPRKATQKICDDILSRATWQTATNGLAATW